MQKLSIYVPVKYHIRFGAARAAPCCGIWAGHHLCGFKAEAILWQIKVNMAGYRLAERKLQRAGALQDASR